MLSYLLLGVMILMYTLQSIFTRKYSDHYPHQEEFASPVFTIFSGITVVIISIIMCKFSFEASWQTVLLGVINGFSLILYNTAFIKASRTGPYSVLMVFVIAGGILIPTAVGAIAFSDRITLVRIICMAVVLVAVPFVCMKDERTKQQKGFFIACALLGIGNGLYGTMLDVQQRLTGAGEKEEMVAITFFVAVVISCIVLFAQQKRRFFSVMKQTKRSAFYLALASLVVAGAIHLLTAMLGMMDLALLYTFDNSGVLMFSVLCSWIFFKEKLSLKNWLGCAAMCIALTLMMGWDWIFPM